MQILGGSKALSTLKATEGSEKNPIAAPVFLNAACFAFLKDPVSKCINKNGD